MCVCDPRGGLSPSLCPGSHHHPPSAHTPRFSGFGHTQRGPRGHGGAVLREAPFPPEGGFCDNQVTTTPRPASPRPTPGRFLTLPLTQYPCDPKGELVQVGLNAGRLLLLHPAGWTRLPSPPKPPHTRNTDGGVCDEERFFVLPRTP